MTSRITADLDTKNKFKISFSLIKSIFIIPNIIKLELIPSHSKGFHLIIWSSNKIPLKQQYIIREKIGDDKTRIRLDKKRKIGKNTLFDTKEINFSRSQVKKENSSRSQVKEMSYGR